MSSGLSQGLLESCCTESNTRSQDTEMSPAESPCHAETISREKSELDTELPTNLGAGEAVVATNRRSDHPPGSVGM